MDNSFLDTFHNLDRIKMILGADSVVANFEEDRVIFTAKKNGKRYALGIKRGWIENKPDRMLIFLDEFSRRAQKALDA